MKGILFKEDLFRTVISGRKTQTRRIALPGKAPRYKPGETVFLKEPYHPFDEGFLEYAYRYAQGSPERKAIRWKNKMFMPESAARYAIQISDVDVRLERLWDISPEDCIAEGIETRVTLGIARNYEAKGGGWFGSQRNILSVGLDDQPIQHLDTFMQVLRESYFSLWRSINGKSSFEDNPMVYVYDFELKPEHSWQRPAQI